jgi:hypothetical protein
VVTVRSCKVLPGKQGTHTGTHLGSAVLSETEAFSALQLLPGYYLHFHAYCCLNYTVKQWSNCMGNRKDKIWVLPLFLLWLFLEIGAQEIFSLHQKHWNMKISESLRKEMNSMVVVQFLSMSKATGSIPSTGKK